MFLKCFLTLSFWKQCTYVCALFPGNFSLQLNEEVLLCILNSQEFVFLWGHLISIKQSPIFSLMRLVIKYFIEGVIRRGERVLIHSSTFFSLTVRLIQHFFIALSFSGSLLGSLLRFHSMIYFQYTHKRVQPSPLSNFRIFSSSVLKHQQNKPGWMESLTQWTWAWETQGDSEGKGSLATCS